ncbi:FAD-binding protein [Synergistales bacterium]|nr:FAD-binding protein [Synergistales bacterium]
MPITGNRSLTEHKEIVTGGRALKAYSFNTVVVGTGAAGYNAADTLGSLGVSVAVVTEGVRMGTSRNTGSDKQTYYKLTMAGGEPDSVLDMANTLFGGGSMHGDISLAEAAMSARCFHKLALIGVPFPHNRYGETVGYKTDHDPRQRATSCGPLTSRYMTERLEEQVARRGIPVFDGYRVIDIITASEGSSKKAVGLLAVDVNSDFDPDLGPELVLFNCVNVVYATGGPSGIYHASVYPESQTCATGAALEAGAAGVNLTESQYGIASTAFRWNLSGSYQQVLPTYISTDARGNDAREFLDGYFATATEMTRAIFLKGYQWPFDPGKLGCGGSSIVDVAVFMETKRERRVFLDFRRNPRAADKGGALAWGLLDDVTRTYLEKSGATQSAPIERLKSMNSPAYRLYLDNGIDLEREALEISVCAQHNNGGLAVNVWWESNLRHFFPVGEVAGTLGVHRPGGSALNSTQVGSTRAAQFIAANYATPDYETPPSTEEFLKNAERAIAEASARIKKIMTRGSEAESPAEQRSHAQMLMDSCGAFVRPTSKVREAIDATRALLASFESRCYARDTAGILNALINRDILLTQLAYLSAITEYIERGGRSRGSYLVCDSEAEIDTSNCAERGIPTPLDGGAFSDRVCEVHLELGDDGLPACRFQWSPVRPIPTNGDWFENVYNAYIKGEIIR